MSLTDSNGVKIVEGFMKLAKSQEGGGFINYDYPKAGETQPSPKRAYVHVYEPFNWVIGTGNYIDSIDKIVSEQENINHANFSKNIIAFLSIILIFVVIIILVSVWFSKKLSKDFSNVTYGIKELSNYNLLL